MKRILLFTILISSSFSFSQEPKYSDKEISDYISKNGVTEGVLNILDRQKEGRARYRMPSELDLDSLVAITKNNRIDEFEYWESIVYERVSDEIKIVSTYDYNSIEDEYYDKYGITKKEYYNDDKLTDGDKRIIVGLYPLFPGCESFQNDINKRQKCFNDKINGHLKENYNYPSIAQSMGIQGKVLIKFIVDEDGYIIIVKVDGPDANLNLEAVRIIHLLPKITESYMVFKNPLDTSKGVDSIIMSITLSIPFVLK